MDILRPSHVPLSDDTRLVIKSQKDKDSAPTNNGVVSNLLVTAGKEEPHTSKSFQLYSLIMALVTILMGPPAAKSAVTAASYFLLGSKHYGSILLGLLRALTFSSAAVRLELGLTKVNLRSLMDQSQLLLCLDSLALIITVVTTWAMPPYVLAWAAIRRHADAHSVMSLGHGDLWSGLEILGIAALSLSLIFLEGKILSYSVQTQKTIERAQIRLTE